jgi:hypothetical protein
LETLATQAKQQEQLEQLEQLQQQLQQQQESMDRGLIATTTLSTKEFPKPPFRLEETSLHSLFSLLFCSLALIKKKIKVSLYTRKFKMEQLQSHM